MRASVIVFPGSNCDRDAAVALEAVTGEPPLRVWHGDRELPKSDLIVLPGGFSYGDYLRSGAMAAHSPITRALVEEARKGVAVLGICNGFQVLTETGLLPGALMRNASLKYICKDVYVKPERTDTVFSKLYDTKDAIKIPIAHKDGNYFADDETLELVEGEGRIAFRYCDEDAFVNESANPNGSQHNIAGLYDRSGRILGMMPHPERAVDPLHGGTDGCRLFESLISSLH